MTSLRIKQFFSKFDFNSPVILTMTFLSLFVLLLQTITHHSIDRVFGAYFSSFLDPMMYLRYFTHIFLHADFAHFFSNYLIILTVGPLVEEKYGSKTLVILVLITAFLSGLITTVFFRNIVIIGSSSISFMLILLGSFVNMRSGKIPLTVVLISALYIGNQIYSGIFLKDNISNLGHIIGGLCGAISGYIIHKKRHDI